MGDASSKHVSGGGCGYAGRVKKRTPERRAETTTFMVAVTARPAAVGERGRRAISGPMARIIIEMKKKSKRSANNATTSGPGSSLRVSTTSLFQHVA